MLTWCVTTTNVPGPRHPNRSRRACSDCAASAWGLAKNELKAGCAWGTGPAGSANASCAVWCVRHHWECQTAPTATPRCRNTSPIRRACSRPSVLRLRCVVQSPKTRPGGSPPPGASACRNSTMATGAFSAAQASWLASCANAGPTHPAHSVKRSAQIGRAVDCQRKEAGATKVFLPPGNPRSGPLAWAAVL